MRRGDIYPVDRAERALANFFRRGNLIALREMALHRMTRAVDRTLDDYVKRKQLGPHWSVTEKVAVCISNHARARDLIARGAPARRRPQRRALRSPRPKPTKTNPQNASGPSKPASSSPKTSAPHIVHLTGKRVASAAAAYITEQRITQALFGRSALHGLKNISTSSPSNASCPEAPHVDLHIVTQEDR